MTAGMPAVNTKNTARIPSASGIKLKIIKLKKDLHGKSKKGLPKDNKIEDHERFRLYLSLDRLM